MATVLGIYQTYPCYVNHEPSACIIRDGEIVAAVEEDRITRVKHQGNCPPYNSIKEVFRISGISPDEIDVVAIPWLKPTELYKLKLREASPKNFPRRVLSFPIYKRWEEETKNLLKSLGLNSKIKWVEHHLSHAASAHFTSGKKESTTITLDGWGDGKSSAVYHVKNNKFKEISCSKKSSLGSFYEAATEAIGFKPNDGEGKTMGFASYGDPSILFTEIRKMISIKDTEIMEKVSFGSENLEINVRDSRLFSGPRHTKIKNNPFKKFLKEHKKEDIAAAAQKVLEESAVNIVRNAIRKTGCKSICLAGGVALNVKMNMEIQKLPEVESLHVFPNPGDSGVAVGAALYACYEEMKKKGKTINPERMLHTYYGSEFSDAEILDAINEYRLNYKKIKNPPKTAAELINKGKVVGWFQGAQEFGPRALGNRSVLADPRNSKFKEKINKFLKKRDWFMPFAPSILLEDAKDYVENAEESPFMIVGFMAKKDAIKKIPCAIHVDGSLRPQTVRKDTNPEYYNLIKHFKKLTGIPLVLNTSFNRHGLPLVRTPQEALDHVILGNVEFLVMGNYLIDAKVNIKNTKASKEFVD